MVLKATEICLLSAVDMTVDQILKSREELESHATQFWLYRTPVNKISHRNCHEIIINSQHIFAERVGVHGWPPFQNRVHSDN